MAWNTVNDGVLCNNTFQHHTLYQNAHFPSCKKENQERWRWIPSEITWYLLPYDLSCF